VCVCVCVFVGIITTVCATLSNNLLSFIRGILHLFFFGGGDSCCTRQDKIYSYKKRFNGVL